ARLEALITPVLTGLMAALLQIVSLLCLMLGRYWQSVLYNPGGFGLEFRALRLSPPLAFGLLAVMFLAPNLGHELAMLTPMCCVAWLPPGAWPGSGWLGCMYRCCCLCSWFIRYWWPWPSSTV